MKQNREETKDKGLQSFVDEYITTKNVLIGLGVASLASVATYSTVRALKNERLVNRVKRELNFDTIKNSISSRLGLGKGKEGRSPVKNKNSKKETKSKSKKRYVTG